MMAISHIRVASHSLLARPPRMCCRTPSTNGGSHSTVTLAAQSMASRAAAAAMASFIRAVALRLAAALSGATAACVHHEWAGATLGPPDKDTNAAGRQQLVAGIRSPP